MGKSTGFLEFQREESRAADPRVRVKNFNEFHAPLNKDERKKQGARCMNCGVPFCQSAMNISGSVSGCPLHNLIPEWNDEIYNGNWEHALARLTKTNSFPEFTGRVCPALCEAACSCGLYGDSVTVKENELAIIENAFADGNMKPCPPEVRTGKRVAVIGSGPSGLACAERLNKRGHSVTVFEKDDRIGGLLMYGIPNMKLEKHIIDRRVKLLKAEGIEFITNAEVGVNVSAEDILKDYDAAVLCCGAGNPRDIDAENRNTNGVYFAVDFLKSTTKALLDNGLTKDYVSAENKNVIVIGGGDTGNDCVGTCIRHGAKSVKQLEIMPCPPTERTADNCWPRYPRTLKTDYGQEEAIALYGADPRIYCTTVKEIIPDEAGNIKAVKTVEVEFKTDKNGKRSMCEKQGSEKTLDCELLLIAAGFTGAKKDLPELFGVALSGRNTVLTEDGKYKTNIPKVFTAGDMHRGQSLVVWAIAEGRDAAKEIDEYLMGYTNLI